MARRHPATRSAPGPYNAGMGLRVGDLAPDFEAASDDGRRVWLGALRGAWVVLCFLPRSGGVAEARQWERVIPDLERLGACLLAVSGDTEAHAALLRERAGLSYPLLPDLQRRVSRAYGVSGWLGLTRRHTFLISPEGRLARHWRGASPLPDLLTALGDPARSTPRPAGS